MPEAWGEDLSTSRIRTDAVELPEHFLEMRSTSSRVGAGKITYGARGVAEQHPNL